MRPTEQELQRRAAQGLEVIAWSETPPMPMPRPSRLVLSRQVWDRREVYWDNAAGQVCSQIDSFARDERPCIETTGGDLQE